MFDVDELGKSRASDALGMMFGACLGNGEHRTVYQHIWNSGFVIKVEREVSQDKFTFANVMEWIVWNEIRGTKWEKWFAPVHDISKNGLVLVQHKCAPLEERPKKVPSFFGDLKRENWGTLDGRPVCFDYANHRHFLVSCKNAKMVKPKWHDLK